MRVSIRYRWLILPVLIVLFACPSCLKRETSQEANGSGCISRVTPKLTDSLLSWNKLDSINKLFLQNNLSTVNFQFYSFRIYPFTGSSYTGNQVQVLATQYFNGLPLFTIGGDKMFLFNAGQLQPRLDHYWDGYDGPAPGPDTTGHQALSTLRSAYYDRLAQYVNPGGPMVMYDSLNRPVNYYDSCLVATLGYIDASWTPGSNINPNTALLKVWKVTLVNSGPPVFVQDYNGASWPVALTLPKNAP